jgi:hypothetical protein
MCDSGQVKHKGQVAGEESSKPLTCMLCFVRCVQGGRAVHLGEAAGFSTGEGKSAGDVPTHKVKIRNHYADQDLELDVPEDR